MVFEDALLFDVVDASVEDVSDGFEEEEEEESRFITESKPPALPKALILDTR